MVARCAVSERGLGVDHDGQRVVVDDDQLGGVDGLRASLGDNRGHDVADEAHHPVGKRRAVERGWQHHKSLHRLEAHGLVGVDGQDTGHGFGFAGVDARYPCVRDRRAHEHDVRATRRHEVVEVLRLTREDPRIFDATYRVAENRTGGGHGRTLRACDGGEASVDLVDLPDHLGDDLRHRVHVVDSTRHLPAERERGVEVAIEIEATDAGGGVTVTRQGARGRP